MCYFLVIKDSCAGHVIFWVLFLGLLNACVVTAQENGSQDADDAQKKMGQLLAERVASQPADSSNWRMLGRWRFQQGDIDGSLVACKKAVELEPESASAQFDYGQALMADEQWEDAFGHFEQVIEIAPDSKYGDDARVHLQTLQAKVPRPDLVSPRSDLSPNRFGGIPSARDDLSNSNQVWDLQLDVGLLFNSNVQLAPINRDVTLGESESFQFFMAPQFQRRTLGDDIWSAGFVFNGYFTFNEGNQSDFNLQDYRPGFYWERSFEEEEALITRSLQFQYDFALNQFAGETVANRHSLTSSWIVFRQSTESVYYWTIDYSNFFDDEGTPSITSADGWTNTIGGSHGFYLDRAWVQLLRMGADVQMADLVGSDYTYDGVFIYAGSESRLPWQWQLDTQLGWGHRNYKDFIGSPSRNENLVHASLEVYRDFSDHWRMTAFATYDRFASPNPLFDSERYLIGLMTSYIR